MSKDDKNRHFVLLIIDISKHGAKEMSHVKMAGPGFRRLALSIASERQMELLYTILDIPFPC